MSIRRSFLQVVVLSTTLGVISAAIASPGSTHLRESAGDPIDPYVKGEMLWENGEKEATLNLWESVYDSMKSRDVHDPRIGFRFIEYAVAQHDTGRYETATEMHSWGLQASFEDRFSEAAEREMLMVKPLLNNREGRSWQRMFDDREDQLFREMSDFWGRNNLVASTSHNERLIEHWERIRFSREHFTENKNTIYDTDDRALIYVRLGPPDDHKRGPLSFNSTEIRNLLYDLVELGVIRSDQIYNLQMNILSNYSPRDYEYWRYSRVSEEGPVIYLFGQPGGGGRFQLMNSLDEFIPRSGYNSVVVGNRGHPASLRAGIFLQFMLYNEMASVDHYFGNRLLDYERHWQRAVSHSGINGNWLADMLSPSRASYEMRDIRNRSPESLSMYERNLAEYPIYHRDYRFWDEEAGPISYLLMNPSPRIAITTHMVSPSEKTAVAEYYLKQGFNTFKNGRQISRHVEEIHPGSDGIDVIDESFYVGTMIPAVDNDVRVQVFSELYVQNRQDTPIAGKNHLIGLSRKWTDLSGPLENNGSILLSDLVLGSTDVLPVSVRSADIGLLSGNELSRDGSLQVYFEVYSLQPDDQGTSRYQITYQLEPESSSWFLRRWFRRSSHDVTLTWEATSHSANDWQFFDVDLSHTSEGAYTLKIDVEDLVSGNEFSREEAIELK